MSKTAIITDSNSGITQALGKELGISYFRCLLTLVMKHFLKIST